MRRTKIVCTLGPATESPDVVRGLLRAGMDVARVNFSHGSHEEHAAHIARVRELAAEEGRVLAILADLQGPKLRIGPIAAGQATLQAGAELVLTTQPAEGDEHRIHVPHPELIAALKPGNTLLLDDGALELHVLSVTDDAVTCQVVAGGVLLPHKGISAPRAPIQLPAITEKDRLDLTFALAQNVDYIALSFVRRAADIGQLRELIDDGGASTPIIAKIEKPEALDDLDAILSTADGVMIARGDLGVEMPPERVPLQQKRIIELARRAAKPVITATQMLESMIKHPRPTRAEASDVANAIFDGTDAVMLSGETAIGHYPVKAVDMMARIAETTEAALPYEEQVLRARLAPAHSVTDAISQATCEIAYELNVKAIVPSTMSGHTARMISRHRPRTPILVVTPREQIQRRLALVWGVQSVHVTEYQSTDAMFEMADRAVIGAGLAQVGDIIVITAGVPMGGQGKTNMLKIHTVGSV